MAITSVTHIINSLTVGGAEVMLCNLVSHYDRERFPTKVVTLIDDHSMAGPLRNLGVPIVSMGMRPGIPNPKGAVRLFAYLRKERPAVVHTWMDHSNLIGGVAARLATSAPVIWGIHHVNHGPGFSKPTTRLTVAGCAKLSSRIPSTIVCCSDASRLEYLRMGFASSKLRYVPNGFDSRKFAPDPRSRTSIRAELGIDEDAVLVGIAARFDPLKDHDNFLNAAALVAQRFPNTRFLLCGKGVDSHNDTLMGLIHRLGIESKCRLIGARHDMPRIFSALDIATSSSISEAFPLAVGEAMATGVPCVGTDVGDTARLVGETGRVVPSRSPELLADALIELISLESEKRRELGLKARNRIQTLFDLTAVSQTYEEIYQTAASLPTLTSSPSESLLMKI